MAIVELEALEEGPASEVLGSPASPFDVPDMSIWDAVYWVAREGGARDFDVNDRSVWDSAITAVVDRLRAGEMSFSGQRSENSFTENLPGMVLRCARIVHPYQGASADADLAQFDGVRLELGGAEGDRLFAPASEETRLNLRITSADLARFWPFASRPTGIEGLTEVRTPSGHWVLQAVPTASRQPVQAAEISNFETLTVPAAPSRKPATSSGKKRGVRPKVFNQVVDAMRADLASSALTPASLDQMIEKKLEERYGASRDTCRRARAAVLAGCEPNTVHPSEIGDK